MKKNNKKHYELTILNPHADDFYCAPVSFFFLKRKALRKYSYILDRATTSFSKLNILIDCRLSSLIPHQFFIKLPFLVRKFLLTFEIYLWRKLNKIDSHIEIHWVSKTISCKKYIYDLLRLFVKKSAANWYDLRDRQNYDIVKKYLKSKIGNI